MSRADRLAHLAGYAALVTVLATASWVDPLGALLGLLFVVAVIVYFAIVSYQILESRIGPPADRPPSNEEGIDRGD